MLQEREKWEAIYKDHTDTTVDSHIERFNAEFVETIKAMLPAGASIAELGCGAAWHSLALAKTGRYRLSCLDFSPAALRAAQQVFQHYGQQAAFREENAFEPGRPQYDLVFNSGVLEHYDLPQQIALVKGLASRSKQYVLVLIPNSLCYWYWVWRLCVSGKGQWPYGKEVPRCNLQDVFTGAGLQFVGQKFFAQDWAELFINQTLESSPELRDLVLRVHRMPGIGREQKSYLVAGLGVLPELETGWLKQMGWQESSVAVDFTRDELATALADSTAAQIFLTTRLSDVDTRRPLQEALAQEQQARESLEEERGRLEENLAHTRQALAQEQQARESLEKQWERANTRASHLCHELDLALDHRETLEDSLRHIVQERHAAEQRLAQAQQRLALLESHQAAPKRLLHVLLDIMQTVTPGFVRASVRKYYLRYFYYRVYPEKRSGQHVFNPPADGGTAASLTTVAHSGYPPFVAFKTQLCKALPLDFSGLSTHRESGLVSIVLPVYNGARYIRESLDSVLGQTYPHFELIVVDDGSTDETPALLSRYADDPRVRIIRQSNQRLPAALTNGFSHARGEFYTWTSADNIMLPDHLTELVQFLRSHPEIELVYADEEIMDEDGRPLKNSDFCPGYQTPPGSECICWPRDPGELNFIQNNYIGACFLYRAWAGKILGAYADGTLGFEDYEYWMRMNALFRIAHLGKRRPLYRYRLHTESLSARDAELGITDRVRDFMAVEEERRRIYLRGFDITLVGKHAWFPDLSHVYRQAGHNVFEYDGTEDNRYHYTVTRAHKKSFALFGEIAGHDSALETLRADPAVKTIFLLDDAKVSSCGDDFLERFDWLVATGESAWKRLDNNLARRALLAQTPANIAYPLLALMNRMVSQERSNLLVAA